MGSSKSINFWCFDRRKNRLMRTSQFDFFWKKAAAKPIAAWTRLSAYAVTIRPYTLTLSAVLLTVSVARMISYRNPKLHWETQGGLHIHHYTFGIFALAIAGYAALVFKGPRAGFWIALLYGFGLGLVFDEFGLWLHLRQDPALRWSYTGLVMIAVVFLVGIAWAGILKREPRSSRVESLSGVQEDAEAVTD
jgi:hypothetical protein